MSTEKFAEKFTIEMLSQHDRTAMSLTQLPQFKGSKHVFSMSYEGELALHFVQSSGDPQPFR